MFGKAGFVLPLVVLIAPFARCFGADEFIPAGSLLQCTVSEPNFSSKTADIGDPVLCQANPVEKFGRSVLPYGTYLEGRFEDYKDPGHFVGRGWMELKFDRMVIPPGQIIPLSAKVVYAPGLPVDKFGKIHGTGHPVRDAVMWSIPVLWPIDLLMLPERGPRPRLKAETRLTLKIMDDIGVPLDPSTRAPYSPSAPSPYGFSSRPPVSAAPPAYPQYQQPSYPAPALYGAPAAVPAPPPAVRPFQQAAFRPNTADSQITVLVMKDGNARMATNYWFENGVQVRYVGLNGVPVVVPIEMLDLASTAEANRRRGVGFGLRMPGAF